MKTHKSVFLFFIALSVLTGCSKTFEAKDVAVVVPDNFRQLVGELLEIPYLSCIKGDISYRAKEALAIKTSEEDDYLYFYYDIVGDYLSISDLPKNKHFTIESTSDGGYKLFVQAKDVDGDVANYTYEKIILIHGQDSIVGKNIKFLNRYCDEASAFRPCSGKIEKYHMEYGTATRTMSMEATKNGVVWRKYYPNGNIQSEKRVEDVAIWDDMTEDAFVTTSSFYKEDGTEDKVFMGREFAVYETNVTNNITNSKYYVILYPNSSNNTNIGDLLIVSSKNVTYSATWEGEYKYEIKGNQLYLSEGRCASSWFNDRKKVSMRHQEVTFSSPQIFYINNFCNANLTAECNLLDNIRDSDWFMSLRRKYFRR